MGLLHGGASVALGSWAAIIHASSPGKVVVGLDVNGTHHRSAREGMVTGIATAVSPGRRITSHEVIIFNEAEDRLCTVRITNLVVDPY